MMRLLLLTALLCDASRLVATASPAPKASRFCVSNMAGFVMEWAMTDLNNGMSSSSSGTYPIDQTRCLPLAAIPKIAEGDMVIGRVHAVDGISQTVESGVIAALNDTTAVATFACTGTTLDYQCKLIGDTHSAPATLQSRKSSLHATPTDHTNVTSHPTAHRSPLPRSVPSGGLIRSPLSPPAPRITGPIPRSGDLPSSFDWRNVNGQSYVTTVRNQFLPAWCGSCWAQAVTSSLSDRLKISRMRSGLNIADIDLSPQPLLDCATAGQLTPFAGSCSGGDDFLSYEWIHQHGITDTTCSPYRAADDQCFRFGHQCRICYKTGECKEVLNVTRYYVDQHGGFTPTSGTAITEGALASNMTAMMYEIFHRGPISCSIYANVEAFRCYNGDGVIDNPPITEHTTHVISLVGWGEEENGGLYWVGRHSGGVHWGQEGFFKLRRGNNTLRIEEFCYWGTLKKIDGDDICTD